MNIKDVLLLVAVACLAIALVWGTIAKFYYLFKPSQKPHHYAALILLGLVSVFALIFGSIELYDIKTSVPVHLVGRLSNIRPVSGGKNHNTFFWLTTTSGTYNLSVDYIGPELVVGGVAEVSFPSKMMDVTYLRVLAPAQYSAFEIHQDEDVGDANSMLLIGIGLVALIFVLYKKGF